MYSICEKSCRPKRTMIILTPRLFGHRVHINHIWRGRHLSGPRLITFERWLSAYDANLPLIYTPRVGCKRGRHGP